MELLI
ncbi:hypothetical protein D031_4616A, partial [Vibrio parahaemolyticus VP-48]